MTLYPYETQLVVDGDGEHVILNDASVGIYDPADTALATLLPLVDSMGVALTNPLQASPQGFLPAFQATVPQVMWATAPGGVYGYLTSFKGMIKALTPVGGLTGQVLTKNTDADFDSAWHTPQQFVVIGPTDPWPTGLPDGTIVIRTEV